MSYSTYVSNHVAFERVFTATIAASVGVATDAVKNLVVSDPTAFVSSIAVSVSSNLRAGAKEIRADAVGLKYTIEVPSSSGVTYDQLVTQLTNSVQNGQFSTQLQQNAATQNVPELSSATTSSIDTQDTTPAAQPSSDDPAALSAGAIAGISTGGFAALVILICIVYYLCRSRAVSAEQQAPPPVVATVETTEAVETVQVVEAPKKLLEPEESVSLEGAEPSAPIENADVAVAGITEV